MARSSGVRLHGKVGEALGLMVGFSVVGEGVGSKLNVDGAGVTTSVGLGVADISVGLGVAGPKSVGLGVAGPKSVGLGVAGPNVGFGVMGTDCWSVLVQKPTSSAVISIS